MSGVHVSVLEKKTISGGLAIIRVEGVKDWPDGARIVIEPLDAALTAAERNAWPAREIAPLTVSREGGAIELLVGPDIVDSPALMPGTPVLLSVPQAGITSEITWPRLTPSRFRRWAPVAMTAEQMQKIIAEQRAEATMRVARSIAEATRQEQEAAAAAKEAAAAEAARAQRQPGATEPAPATASAPRGDPRREWALRLAAFAAGIALAFMGALAVGDRFAGSGSKARTERAAQTATVAPIVLPDDVFTAGAVSPRRRSSGGVDVAEALRLADFSLRGSSGVRDEVEGGFWLKQALAGTVQDPQLRWALTQLGTVYASPSEGLPDYARARALWEVAALLGDGTAMCFLGHLHRHGLGTSASAETARLYYTHPRTAADCQRR